MMAAVRRPAGVSAADWSSLLSAVEEYREEYATLNDDEREASVAVVLTAAYWRLREHASAYRGAKAFRTTFERWQANRDDPRAYQKHVIHEFYARGIEAAAREIVELAGVTEQEFLESAPYSPREADRG